jgi:preprotein translocase subunit SecG
MYVVFIVLTVIVAIMLIGIVLIQKSKGGGLSSQFGGGNQVLGVRGTNSFLEKTTWTLAALIVVFSVGAAYTLPKAGNANAVRVEATGKAAPQQANAFATDAANEKAAEKAAEKTAAPAAEKPAAAPAAAEAPAGK